ncbi:SEC-C metal-binding domain-containing protein [Heyndrickxia sp. NPDC080065]|uniref:SEC-C metal-binding domain-containing protein n=1 Tax=Heyndrickxia sp. NPDC080065 TaxID=3390568 RepID=UPI003CFD7727
MKKDIDNKISNKLQEALVRAKEMNRKTQERIDQKVWSDIQVPITLHDGLSRLTKNDLDTIRKKLEIKNASSLKKAELIALLEEKIPELLEKVILQLDQERYQIIRNIVSKGGYISAQNLKTNQINYYRSLGFIFTGTYEGKRIFSIPKEIMEKLILIEKNNKIDSIISQNTEWIKLTHGLLYYYGTVSIADLIDLMEKYTNVRGDLSEYLSVIYNANLYYQEFRSDNHDFSNARVFDPEKVIKEQKMRKDLNFYPFTKQQLLKAGEIDYVDRTDSYVKLVSYINDNYDITKQEADSIAEECVYATRIGEKPADILQYLSSRLELESLSSVQAIMGRVVELMNNTRQWFLKGYSPNELAKQEKKSLQPLPSGKNNIINMKTKKKIGRNEPCPCGSGKKYKKCCGR